MRWSILLFLLLATVAIHGEEEEEIEEWQEVEAEEIDEWDKDAVLALTADNFQSYIDENEFVLVEFYAPWCDHCKSFAPAYAKVAEELEETGSKVKVVKIDASKDPDISADNDIRGFPTVKLYRSGSSSTYWGGKLAKNIVDWINKKTGPVAIEIENVKGAEELIKSRSVIVLGFFNDRESDEANEFLSAADDVDDYLFGITSNKKVYTKYGAESGSIILFKNFDDESSIFVGDISKTAITEFVAVNSAPLIIDYNRNFIHSAFSVVKSHLLMFISKEEGHMEKYAQPARDVAKQFRGKVLFIAINTDASEEDHQRILSFFRMEKKDIPTMRLIVEEVTNKYKPKVDDLSPEYIRSFVQDGLDGKLKIDLLAQDLPEDWDKNPVKTLVSTNFDEVALNKDKDVFVAFYAPWSDESKELEPLIDELGETYKDSKTVVIARIDSSKNELDSRQHPQIMSYPTLRLYKRGDNLIIHYNGEKTVDSLVKFIEGGGEETEFEVEIQSEENEVSENKDEL